MHYSKLSEIRELHRKAADAYRTCRNDENCVESDRLYRLRQAAAGYVVLKTGALAELQTVTDLATVQPDPRFTAQGGDPLEPGYLLDPQIEFQGEGANSVGNMPICVVLGYQGDVAQLAPIYVLLT